MLAKLLAHLLACLFGADVESMSLYVKELNSAILAGTVLYILYKPGLSIVSDIFGNK